MAYTLPTPGQIFERDGKRREVVAVHRSPTEMTWIEWRRPGADYSVNGANILTWHNWEKKAIEVCYECWRTFRVPNVLVEGAEGCLQPQAPSPTPGSAD